MRESRSVAKAGGQLIRAIFLRVAAALVILSVAPTPAWAYLDPGTGSILVQLLIGGIAGFLVVIKLYWHRLKAFLLRWRLQHTR